MNAPPPIKNIDGRQVVRNENLVQALEEWPEFKDIPFEGDEFQVWKQAILCADPCRLSNAEILAGLKSSYCSLANSHCPTRLIWSESSE